MNDLPLAVEQTKSGTLKLAPERFKNASEVQSYCAAMVSADSTRSNWRSRIENHINGAQPINPAVLRERKLAWYPNVSYRGLEGYIDTPRTAFYDLVTEVDPCIEVRLDFGTGQQKAQWEEVISRHFTWLMLAKWRLGFNYHIPLHQREMLVHGLGAHVWPQMNVANWIPRTPRAGQLLFPDGTPSDFENEGDAFVLRDFVPTHALYNFIRNEKTAADLGWNPDMVWKVMSEASRANKASGFNFESWKRQEKSGDQGGSMARAHGVTVNWLFIRELEIRKFSLYALADGCDTKDYLFKKRNAYDEWPLTLFPYDIGNGDVHSIRGLGARCKDFFELDNQIKNSMAAQVLLGNTIPLKQTGSIDPSKLKLTKMGMMSLLPQNTEIATGFRFPDLSQGPIALWRELQTTLSKNNGAYVSGSPEARDRETATSYSMRAQDASLITKGTQGLYGSHFCLFYEKMFRMVVKSASRSGDGPHIAMAKEFMRRCERDGVPREAFDNVEEIKELFSTGAGSPSARLNSLMLIMNTVFPNTTDDRKINILRDLTAVAITGAKVDRYAPSLSDNDTSDSDDSIIALENNALTEGKNAAVTDRQNHIRHSQRHLEAAGTIMQALEEGQVEVEMALGALMALGQHVTQHYQRMADNPTLKKEAGTIKKDLNQLANVVNQLQQQVEAAQDQPEPEQQLSEQGQISMMKVQQDSEIKRAKMQQDAQLKMEKLRFQQRLEDARTAIDIRRGK